MKTILFLLATLTTFLAPIKGLLIFMILLIALDTIVAMHAAIKLKGFQSITSTKFFNIVVKSFFYLTTIIMAYLLDLYVMEGELLGIKLLLAKAMMMVWSYNELNSINETSIKLGNRSFWFIFKEFIGKIKDIKKDINDIVGNKKEE
jgi:hypothetical protein